VLSHDSNLGHDGFASPLDAKDLCELLEILCAGLADAKHGVAKPRHAQRAELLVEKFYTELRGEQRYVLNDGQSYAPLLVLCELYDRRKE